MSASNKLTPKSAALKAELQNLGVAIASFKDETYLTVHPEDQSYNEPEHWESSGCVDADGDWESSGCVDADGDWESSSC